MDANTNPTEAPTRRLKLNKTTLQILSAGQLEQISGGRKYETFSKWCTGETTATCQGTSTEWTCSCVGACLET